MNTKISKRTGRRGKIVLAILVTAMFIGVASAALLPYYNKVTTTATVSQSVLVDGKDYTDPITNEYNITAGCCKSSHHLFESRACVNAPIEFNTTYLPDGGGITTTYCTPTDYAFETTIGKQPVLITVTDGDCQITWTIDFPMEAPYDPIEGNGSLVVGLIIAQNGEGYGPSFQIHNNDGTDSNYDWGTWLWSPWGPTINEGWFGWHSGNINVLVSDLDWVECTGNRYHSENEDGIFTITIPKCVLGADFHWALNLAIGSGFSGEYYIYEQMAYPVATPGSSFNWGTPIVNMTVPNYELATIMEDLGAGFILGAYQSKEIIICNRFDVGMTPGIYTIISSFVPATTP